jgi:hypothetical protein
MVPRSHACFAFNLTMLVMYPAILFLNLLVLMSAIWFKICLFSSKTTEYRFGSFATNSLAMRFMKSGRTFPIISRISCLLEVISEGSSGV